MTNETARSVLRLVAVATMLVGAILTTITIITLIGATSAAKDLQGMQVEITGAIGKMGFLAVLADVSIFGWGFLLFGISPSLAEKIAS